MRFGHTVFRNIVIGCALWLFLISSAVFAESDSSKEKKRQDLLEKIEKLRQQKEALRLKEKDAIQQVDEKSSKNRLESLRLFEQIITTTQRGDPKRCDALFQVGSLYYEEEQDAYQGKLEAFKKQFSIWEKTGSNGAPPVEPIPQHVKSTESLKNLVQECPNFGNRDMALYKLGNIFTEVGDFESAYESFGALVKEFPKSENAPYAHLRIGEYYYMNHDNTNALKHYEAVGMTSGADNYLLSLYRIASCYYNMSQFDNAIDKFFEYVELADSGKFKRADFRDEAVEYLAIGFSEMEGGAEKALEFFKKKGGRPYQDFVIYTIGIKNRDHDNVKEAIRSLNFLLKTSPNYIDAPLALKALIDCYVLEKKYTDGIHLREQMIRDYGPGSAWEREHASEREKIETSRGFVKEAAAVIPIYYHKLGVIARDSGKIDRAKENFAKALVGYDNYITKFPEEKWNAYSFHFFKADLLSDSLIGRYDEAAREFEWVSKEDTTRYPGRTVDAKKLLDDKKKEARDIKDQFHSDIKEQIVTVQVNPQEAGFAAIVCILKITEKALKAHGLNDTTAYQGINLPEMQRYLASIHDFRNRFPNSKHAAEVAFLEANLYYNARDYQKAIEGYNFIMSNFGNNESIIKETLENLAHAYMNIKEFEKAIQIFKRLDHEFNPTPAEKGALMESVAATLFLIAENRQKQGDYTGAADYYKQIVIDYPTFSRCNVALFNAAYSYEQGRMYREAAREFERVFDRFPKYDKRKDAIFRAAHAYQLAGDFVPAAEIFLKFTRELSKDADAVPCIFRAAAMYDSAKDYARSAQTYEKVLDLAEESRRDHSLYPKAAEEAPGAVYSAGFMYEKANDYTKAIGIYEKLEKLFPKWENTPEAAYAIAICHEKMNDDAKMAAAYISYTEKYGSDQAKVVVSLGKAAKAYGRLGRAADQEKMFRTIVQLYKKYGEQYQIDPRVAAEAYFTLGMHAYDTYEKLDLRTDKKGAAGRKDIETKLKAKTDALQSPLNYFKECILLETDEWTTRSTYMCGEAFWNLMETVKSQPIVEKDADKIAYNKVKVNEALPPYYEKALGFYITNVDKFHNQMGVKNEWTDKSADRYAQGWYQLCFSHLENGQIFSAAPNPFPKGTQEFDVYQEQISGLVTKLTSKCVPCLQEAVKNCVNAFIENNSWLERMKQELRRQSPNDEALRITVQPAPKPQVQPRAAVSYANINQAYERSKKAILNIYSAKDIPIEKKISILEGIETSAKRDIERLTVEIQTLKAK
jgi:tetratricopeptide (TPR) repeat protein